MSEKYLLSVSEANEYTKIGKNTLYEWIRSGKIPTVRIGRVIKIHRLGLESFLDQVAEGKIVI